MTLPVLSLDPLGSHLPPEFLLVARLVQIVYVRAQAFDGKKPTVVLFLRLFLRSSFSKVYFLALYLYTL